MVANFRVINDFGTQTVDVGLRFILSLERIRN